MKTNKRINKIAEEYNLKITKDTEIRVLPLEFKLAVLEDLYQHIDDTGIDYPTYGGTNFRMAVINLVKTWEETQEQPYPGYTRFIKESLDLVERILKAYIKGLK